MSELIARKFSEYSRGIILEMLTDAYAKDIIYYEQDKDKWKEFDDFAYDNLNIIDKCGFISTVDNIPIGFVSWDPRKRPIYQIGHNCILNKYKNKGYGTIQMKLAIDIIKQLNPEEIFVTTGTNQFFEPARKMYEKAGLIKEYEFAQDNNTVPQMVKYHILTK